MVNPTYFYVLVYPNIDVFKIGISSDMYVRVNCLKKFLGMPDFSASCRFEISKMKGMELEKLLLSKLQKCQSSFIEKIPGKSEIFSIKEIDSAFYYIDDFCVSRGIHGITKNALTYQMLKSTPKRLRAESKKMRRNIDSFHNNLRNILRKVEIINRIILLLYLKQNEFAYEYDICGDVIYFRMCIKKEVSENWRYKLGKLFKFESRKISDLYNVKRYCENIICHISVDENILCCSVDLAGIKNSTASSLSYYLLKQSEALLLKLPRRSPAAIRDLPMF